MTITEQQRVPDVVIPERDTEDYPTLAAWYSGWAFSEHYRKVCLANCREIVRAQYAVGSIDPENAPTKGNRRGGLSEARIDDLARTHPVYLQFLAHHLKGRTEWEAQFLAQGGMR